MCQVHLASAVGLVELQVWLVPFSCLRFRGPCISEKHSGLHATAYIYVFVIPRVVGHLYPVAVISAEEGGIPPNRSQETQGHFKLSCFRCLI